MGGGGEIERNPGMFFLYILTSGHEGTHGIPTEQMEALIKKSIAPNLAYLVRG